MEIDYNQRKASVPHVPDLPPQRVDSPSMPIRVAPSRPKWPENHRMKKQPRRWALIIVPAVAVLAIGVGLAFMFLIPGSIANASAGDCASFDRSRPGDPYAVVRCSSAQATFAVLDVVGENTEGCREIAGATRSTVVVDGAQRREVCMGPKDLDPAAAINIAQTGDCLTGTTGQEKRVPCTDPTATFQILKRVNHVSTTQVPTTCNGVPAATSVYSWTWDSDDGTGPTTASYQTDAVFCLGPLQR
jgi:hypothetical protein